MLERYRIEGNLGAGGMSVVDAMQRVEGRPFLPVCRQAVSHLEAVGRKSDGQSGAALRGCADRLPSPRAGHPETHPVEPGPGGEVQSLPVVAAEGEVRRQLR